MWSENIDKEELINAIETAYIKFGFSLFDYCEKETDIPQILNNFLIHIRTGIDKFKEEIEELSNEKS